MHQSLKTNINSLATARTVEEGFSAINTIRFQYDGSQLESNFNMSGPLRTFALDKKDDIIAQDVESVECQHCWKWKKWAQCQQKLLLQLQEQLMNKQELFVRTLRQMEQKISQNILVTQQNQKIIQKASLKIQELEIERQSIESEKQSIQQKFERSIKSKQMFATPLRGQVRQNQNQQDQMHEWNRLIVIENVQKNGRTCTTATRGNLQNSAFNMSHDRVIENSQKKSRAGGEIQQIKFENTALKQYNTVLLARIKDLKYRKGL